MQILSFDLLLLSQSGSDRICFIPLCPRKVATSGSWDYAFGRERGAAAESGHEREEKPPTWAAPSTNPSEAGVCEEEEGGHPSLLSLGYRAKAVRAAEMGDEQLPTNKLQAGEQP